MPIRPIRVAPVEALRERFAAIRREAGIAASFPAAVEAEAEAAARAAAGPDRVDLPFVTIDPPGARDLDQALHIERRGEGHRVSYAIADVGAFVVAGGALDREAHARGVTVYMPDGNVPLHPLALSEGAASLLPDRWRQAVLWTLDLDSHGELVGTNVVRAQVRSVAQHTYSDVPAEVEGLLREVGERRIAIENARGGIQLAVPEQEVVRDGRGWTVRYRAPLPSEEWNAQISLLTGMAAARLMLDAGVGILRTQPTPDDRSFERLRRQARALGIDWPRAQPYAELIRTLDPRAPAHAALLHEAAGLGRGAGYTAFDGERPAESGHFAIAADYAHATAPLRRLQDRFVSECCLAACAGTEIPSWVRAGLPRLPEAMAEAGRRANSVERGVVDLVEAVLLAGREGERFNAIAIDDDVVQLGDPAVRGKVAEGCPEPGTQLTVRLDRADPDTRTVAFSVVG